MRVTSERTDLMRVVKTLLLGSAAGLIAAARAQAADLPVKAAPVEYVKICNLYGVGFYYLPGTDTCVKIGAYVRGQYYLNNGSSPSRMALFSSGHNTRVEDDPNNFVFRTRTIMTFDSRSQTDWGTIRAYMNIGWTWDSHGDGPNGSKSLYVNRAFIQWAGFTFGTAESFYDALAVSSFTYFRLYTFSTTSPGINLIAYTTAWGNGISTTVSVEDPRRQGVSWIPGGNFPGGPASIQAVGGARINDSYRNVGLPDIIGNIEIAQAWGDWQVMSAVHQVGASYYYWPCTSDGTTLTQALECGYLNDKYGWAVGTGANINLPWNNKGDRLGFQVSWSKGATRYAINPSGFDAPSFFRGNYSLGMGFWADAVYRDINVPVVVNGQVVNQAGPLELTDAWSFMAAYEQQVDPRPENLILWWRGAD
jgi:hypothetical protein